MQTKTLKKVVGIYNSFKKLQIREARCEAATRIERARPRTVRQQTVVRITLRLIGCLLEPVSKPKEKYAVYIYI